MSDHSTRKARPRKATSERPKKPYPDFPLSPHASGTWQKKIRGKIHYFGRWGRIVNGNMERIPGDGWEQALALYKAQADDLHAGRTPRVQNDELTVAALANHFLTAKQHQLDAKEITVGTFAEYKRTTDRLVVAFGSKRLVSDLASSDFEQLRAEIAKDWGPVRLGNEIQRVRTVFKYGYESALIKQPVRFGPQFKKPSKSVLRKQRAERGQKLFTREQVLALLEVASAPMRAMVLLAVNAGLGNSDCGSLRMKHLDLTTSWLHFPRPKTGIERRAFLWPETVAAIKNALADRPTPKDPTNADLVFVTKSGNSWAKELTTITHEMGKMLAKLGIESDRLSFYALRHTYRTIADATRDFPAIRMTMGHTDHGIDAHYVEGIDDARIVAVAEHVRAWLFGEAPDGGTTDENSDGTEAFTLCDADDSPDHDDGHERPTLRLFAG
jgi:integrase